MRTMRMSWLLMILGLLFLTGCSVEQEKVDPNSYHKFEGLPLTVLNIPVARFKSNCYIAYDPKTLDAVVIDPGGEAEKIISLAKENKLKVKKIILTHGHGDHTKAASEVKKATKAEVLIHSNDASILYEITADRFLTDGEKIPVGGQTLTVVCTPGHTPGGITLVSEGLAFTGDTLFNCGMGRTDLPGGSKEALDSSIKYLLFNLPPSTRIFPGHKTDSTIGAEKSRYFSE
ncbi:MAG: MBL fold metallo-hydrolase [bacterium]|nr:MBL fold metallo-hydrolase [bacterium]